MPLSSFLPKHEMPPKNLPTSTQFKKATFKLGAFRKSITRIDAALDIWHSQKNLANTVLVYKESRHWVKAKGTKQTTSAIKRKTEINKLISQCMTWIFHLDPTLGRAHNAFEINKALRIATPARTPPRPMQGVYKHEKHAYTASNKTHAPSGTRLRMEMVTIAAFQNRNFDDLSEQEYTQVDKALESQYGVVYLKKLERLRHMINIDNNLLKTFDNQNISTNTQYDTSFPYAIDKYGNMFTKGFTDNNIQENHSTFNAGNDVTCAGMVNIQNGVLINIDNNSGHYKPKRPELFNAKTILLDGLGPNTANATITWYDYDVHPGFKREYVFPFGNFTDTYSPADEQYFTIEQPG